MIPDRRRSAVYGLPALPLAALGIPVHVHLPTFYAEHMGLGLAAVGGALAAARLFDAVVDPVAGHLSDRYRRKIWMLAALPVVAVSGWRLFMPDAGIDALYLALWSGLFHAGLTILLITHQAWGTELCDDYHQRNRVAGWREGFAVAGILIAVAAPALLGWNNSDTLPQLFPPVMIALVLAVAVAVAAAPEPQRPARRDGGAVGPLMKNAAFHRLIAAQAVNALANALPATLFLLYVGDRLGRPDLAGMLLLLYLTAALISVPPWLAAARRWGKHKTWAASLCFTASAFFPALFLGPGDWPIFAVICFVTGFGLGADLALPASMLADATDEHKAATGRSHAGLYASLWSLAAKTASVIAVGAAFPLLDWVDFQPGSGQAPAALAVLYAGAPAVLKLSAALMIRRFPLDQARHAELHRRIAQMQETAP